MSDFYCFIGCFEDVGFVLIRCVLLLLGCRTFVFQLLLCRSRISFFTATLETLEFCISYYATLGTSDCCVQKASCCVDVGFHFYVPWATFEVACDSSLRGTNVYWDD